MPDYHRIKEEHSVEDNLALPRRMEVIQGHKAADGLIAAVLPIHYPRALFRAFNILPVEVWGPPGIDASKGAAHLQPYVCSIVHSALAFLQSGGLEVADFLVVPHACDSLQGLGSILIDFIRPPQPVIPIYLPRGRRESDVEYFAAELRSVHDRLGEFTGKKPSEEAIKTQIDLDEEADALLALLHEQRDHLPGSDLDFYRLVRSREYLPAERFMELGNVALARRSETPRRGIPLVISGIVPEPMTMLRMITEMGGRVAADDLACCGRRLYPRRRDQDPFLRMAKRILFAPPDSTRGNSIAERRDHLLQMIERTAAKGVVFYEVKFCEPELFDLPQLRRELEAAGLPTLVVEVDINDPLSHQIRTRLEAFMEMIG